MLRTRKRNTLKGMTLIEVIVGMTIIVLVTIIAYMGVSTAANLTQEGTDLRDLDGPAVSNIEANIKNYKTYGASETEIVQMNVDVVKIVPGEENGAAETVIQQRYRTTEKVGVVKEEIFRNTETEPFIEYVMYMPYKENETPVSTVPEEEQPSEAPASDEEPAEGEDAP